MERWWFTLAVLSLIVTAGCSGSSSTSIPTSPTASGVTLSEPIPGKALTPRAPGLGGWQRRHDTSAATQCGALPAWAIDTVA